jgi:hypothetical protein
LAVSQQILGVIHGLMTAPTTHLAGEVAPQVSLNDLLSQ